MNVSDISHAYQRTFNSAHGQTVLQDLAMKCFAQANTFDPDPHISAYNAGVRSVWLHISNLTHLPPEQVARLIQGLPLAMPEEHFIG